MSRLIPLSIPNFEGNERKYVDEAIEAGWVSTGGAFITKMEEQLASFIKAPGVACCQSGTSAVHLALVETGVKPGDVVLVPSITFIAAVNPVRYQFAQPIFIDCDGSLCMDPVKLRQFCKEECYLQNNQLVYKPTGKIVKAVVVVHVFGNIADMESIMDIAEMYHLKVIEDATEALGSRYTDGPFKGRFAGTIGDYGAFSFNGLKLRTSQTSLQ
jgi:perosamine synthetase